MEIMLSVGFLYTILECTDLLTIFAQGSGGSQQES